VKCYILSGDNGAAAKVWLVPEGEGVNSSLQAHQQLTSTVNNDDPMALTTAGLLHQSVKEYNRALEW